MAEDNVVQLHSDSGVGLTLAASASKNSLIFGSRAVLIVRPDGTKVRGSDNKPLDDLTRDELLSLIDELCLVFTHR